VTKPKSKSRQCYSETDFLRNNIARRKMRRITNGRAWWHEINTGVTWLAQSTIKDLPTHLQLHAVTCMMLSL
jgi:hypothetical protein